MRPPAVIFLAFFGCHHDEATSKPAPGDASAMGTADSSAAASTVPASPRVSVAIPGGVTDVDFAPVLRRIVVSAGSLVLVDPQTHATDTIPIAATSVDEGRGLLFAVDHVARSLLVVDPRTKNLLRTVKVGSPPDEVRFVARSSEIWVTESSAERIEIFSLSSGADASVIHAANVDVRGGPTGLVVDPRRNKAFSNAKGNSVAIDVDTRSVVATWPNGCAASHGSAFDARRGFLFASCAEGKAVVVDVDHGGRILATGPAAAGASAIAYDPKLSHLYVSGNAAMTVFGVGAHGDLALLGTNDTADGARAVAVDDRGQTWIADPAGARVLVVKDAFPASGP